MAVWYLMRSEGLSYAEAFLQVRKKEKERERKRKKEKERERKRKKEKERERKRKKEKERERKRKKEKERERKRKKEKERERKRKKEKERERKRKKEKERERKRKKEKERERKRKKEKERERKRKKEKERERKRETKQNLTPPFLRLNELAPTSKLNPIFLWSYTLGMLKKLENWQREPFIFNVFVGLVVIPCCLLFLCGLCLAIVRLVVFFVCLFCVF